jgi:hypothetical protein
VRGQRIAERDVAGVDVLTRQPDGAECAVAPGKEDVQLAGIDIDARHAIATALCGIRTVVTGPE